MSFYCIYIGDSVQPAFHGPMVTGSGVSSKIATDYLSTQVLCGKVLPPPSTHHLPNELKTSWNGGISPSFSSQPMKQDSTRYFPIFVGDLSPELDANQLHEAFAAFGQTADCKVIRDQQTLKSKGYGFVSFVNREDAERAIGCMNGHWLGSRPIRTNWATRKPTLANQKDGVHKTLTFEEVFSQTGPVNSTVYCGGIASSSSSSSSAAAGLSEELLHQTFSPFGIIHDIRIFKEKGYAFIRFGSKDSACRAIVGVHGSEVNGQKVKCSWGREPNESNPFLLLTQPTINSPLIQPHPNMTSSSSSSSSSSSFASSSSSVCTQFGYWNYASGYGCSPPSAAITGPAHGLVPPSFPGQPPLFTYANYCRFPAAVQWPQQQNGQSASTVHGSISFPGNQQTTILAYQTQQGYQQV